MKINEEIFKHLPSTPSIEVMATNIISLVYTCEVEAGHYPVLLKRKLRPRDNQPESGVPRGRARITEFLKGSK